jgi:hypothetical protein
MGYKKKEAHYSVPIQHQNAHPSETTVPQDFTNINPFKDETVSVSFEDTVHTAL